MSRSQEKVAITREKGVPGGEAIAPGVVAPGLVLAGSSPRPPDLQLRSGPGAPAGPSVCRALA